ncbi:MAG: Zn-ribbon domain-containing OB-fold protein [Aeropyrum sp.]|nr:Zn-ribbon domain-containing OB-fold protein [Aeropyrum sp.]MCE4616287.1 Zn-ribbon domain-containing OB-fold protein [Aeropyrum sp.]
MSQKKLMDEFMAQVESFVEEMKRSMGLPVLLDQKSGAALWYDQRELRIRFTISIEKIRRFFEALAEGKLLATKCVKSGKIYFPPQVDCPDDPSSEIEWVELPREGTLLTYTVINTKPYTFSHYPDYVVGIGRLAEDLNVLAWVRGDPSKLRRGMKVRLEVVKREPEGYYTYEWVPVEG